MRPMPTCLLAYLKYRACYKGITEVFKIREYQPAPGDTSCVDRSSGTRKVCAKSKIILVSEV
jgi:hypothetical protein